MRKLFLLAFAAAALAACDNTDKKQTAAAETTATADSTSATSISWDKTQLDFGKIPEGQKLDIAYDFTNSGNAPLVIKRVEPGCGCTVAETPTAPVAPGKKGSIKASFDSNGRAGVQHKSIYVYSNATGEPQELIFTVEVTKKG
jgi:hypothetical protein